MVKVVSREMNDLVKQWPVRVALVGGIIGKGAGWGGGTEMC